MREPARGLHRGRHGRGEALDHVLLAGPPGLGKTSLAQIVAAELDVPFVQTAGPALERKGDIAAFLTALEPRSVFFVDEIHRLNRARSRRRSTRRWRTGGCRSRSARAPARASSRSTCRRSRSIGATTRAGLLTTPLRDRFGIQHRLEPYDPADLARDRAPLAPGSSASSIDEDGATAIAARAAARRASPTACSSACATTPRSAATGVVDAAAADAALELLEVDERGPGPPRPRDPPRDLREVRRRARSASRRSRSRSARRPTRSRTSTSPTCSSAGCSSARRAAGWRPAGPSSTSGSSRPREPRACSERRAPDGAARTRATLRVQRMAHLFICPNCGNRTDRERSHRRLPPHAKGCAKCGFGFLFELLDDYYPAPDAAFFVCDQQGRVIGCGRGSFELTGLDDERVIGRPVRDVLGLRFDDGEDPVGTALEWGVRVLGKPVDGQRGGRPARPRDGRHVPRLRRRRRAAARADALRSRPAARDDRPPPQPLRSCSSSRACWRRRSVVVATKPTQPGPRPQGRRRAGLPGQADPAAEGHARRDRPRDRHHAQARRPARRLRARDPAPGLRPDRRRAAGRQERRRGRRRRSAPPPSCTSTTGSRTSSAPQTARPAPTNANVTGGPAGGGRAPARSRSTTPSAARRRARRRARPRRPRRARTTSSTRRPSRCSPAPTRPRPTCAREAPEQARSTRQAPPGREVVKVNQGTIVVARRAADDKAAVGPLLRPRGQPGAERHRHQEPRAELRQRPGEQRPADRHLRVHRQGPQRVGRTTTARSPSAAQDDVHRRAASEQTRFQHFAIVLDNEIISRAVHRLSREPGRHRRARPAREISGGFTIQSRAGPRRTC